MKDGIRTAITRDRTAHLRPAAAVPRSAHCGHL